MKFYKETEFQETEIGKIPKDWKIAKLGSLVKYVKGKKPSSLFDERLSEEYIPYLTAEYMRGLDKPKWCNPKLENNVVEVSRDDVVMIWDGSYAGHVFTGFNGILASTMVRITPIVELDKKFLYYYLLVNFEKIRSTTVGTGIPHVNKKVFEEFPIPIPPFAEQQKIAEIFSSIDRAIEDVDKTIAQLEKLKKALMGELLAGRIRVKEVDGKLTFYRETEFQETEIGKIPKDWKTAKLKDVAVEIKSGFASGKRDETDGIIHLRMFNIGLDGTLLFDKIVKVPRPKDWRQYVLKNGDIVLVNTSGSEEHIGKVAFFENIELECTYSNHLTRIRINENRIDSRWVYFELYYLWQTGYFNTIIHQQAGGQRNLPLKAIENLPIALPTIDESRKIAYILSIFNTIIKLYRKEKVEIDHLKRSLMNLLLTGKIRVRED